MKFNWRRHPTLPTLSLLLLELFLIKDFILCSAQANLQRLD